MILSFKTSMTEDVFAGLCPKGFPANLVRIARRKLEAVNVAVDLHDLAVPPGNKLHSLSKDREGQFSIWVNAQFRVCFVWEDGNASSVEIVDYH